VGHLTGMLSSCIRPSVCRKQDIVPNGYAYDHENTDYNSARTLCFLRPKVSAKFQWRHPQMGRHIQVR